MVDIGLVFSIMKNIAIFLRYNGYLDFIKDHISHVLLPIIVRVRIITKPSQRVLKILSEQGLSKGDNSQMKHEITTIFVHDTPSSSDIISYGAKQAFVYGHTDCYIPNTSLVGSKDKTLL